MPNELANKIIDVIEVFMGKIVAQATVKTKCAMIGKTLDTIERNDLDKLAECVAEAMKSFGKDDVAIRNAIKSV